MSILRNKFYRIKKKYWNKLTVLCYHRIEDLVADPINITVGLDNFLEQIDWLKKSTNIITPEQFEKILLSRKTFPKRATMLTFDDGYLSYKNTMSVLKDYSIPAIFFFSTPKKLFYWDFLTKTLILTETILDKNYEVFSEILDYLNIDIKIEKTLDKKSIERIKNWKLPSEEYPFERCKAFYSITNRLENEDSYSDKSIYKILNKINEHSFNFDFTYSNDTFMKYHTIGSHTSNHFNLRRLQFSDQKKEIIENKIKLEKNIKKEIRFFAYPFGTREHYNKKSVELVKKYFQFSFSNFQGQIHKDSNYYELPRFLVRDWGIEDFKTNIEKFINYKK